MASVHARNGKWQVKWLNPDGTRGARTCPTAKAANELKRRVEHAVAQGRRWVPEDESPLEALGTVMQRFGAEQLIRRRARTVERTLHELDQFLEWMERRHRGGAVITDLSKPMLVDWYNHLRTREPVRTMHEAKDGREYAHTRRAVTHNTAVAYVATVEQFWRWASENDEADPPIVPRARTLALEREQESGAVSAPTWAEMDEVIAVSSGWYQRLAIVLRFTGLRVSQVLALAWTDVDLDRRILVVRPNLPGSKSKNERRGRRIPISAHLAAELAGWGTREGDLIERTKGCGQTAAADRLTRAWRRSGVRDGAWISPHRVRRSPDHAFRAGFQSGLLELGADGDAVEMLVGHSLGGVRDVYVDPTSLPMRAAVDLIPPMGVGGGNVVRLRNGAP